MAKSSKTSAEPPAYSSSATGGYDRDRVASRAYELYMARGAEDGNDMEDWLTAEREVSTNGGGSAEGTE